MEEQKLPSADEIEEIDENQGVNTKQFQNEKIQQEMEEEKTVDVKQKKTPAISPELSKLNQISKQMNNLVNEEVKESINTDNNGRFGGDYNQKEQQDKNNQELDKIAQHFKEKGQENENRINETKQSLQKEEEASNKIQGQVNKKHNQSLQQNIEKNKALGESNNEKKDEVIKKDKQYEQRQTETLFKLTKIQEQSSNLGDISFEEQFNEKNNNAQQVNEERKNSLINHTKEYQEQQAQKQQEHEQNMSAQTGINARDFKQYLTKQQSIIENCKKATQKLQTLETKGNQKDIEEFNEKYKTELQLNQLVDEKTQAIQNLFKKDNPNEKELQKMKSILLQEKILEYKKRENNFPNLEEYTKLKEKVDSFEGREKFQDTTFTKDFIIQNLELKIETAQKMTNQEIQNMPEQYQKFYNKQYQKCNQLSESSNSPNKEEQKSELTTNKKQPESQLIQKNPFENPQEIEEINEEDKIEQQQKIQEPIKGLQKQRPQEEMKEIEELEENPQDPQDMPQKQKFDKVLSQQDIDLSHIKDTDSKSTMPLPSQTQKSQRGIS